MVFVEFKWIVRFVCRLCFDIAGSNKQPRCILGWNNSQNLVHQMEEENITKVKMGQWTYIEYSSSRVICTLLIGGSSVLYVIITTVICVILGWNVIAKNTFRYLCVCALWERCGHHINFDFHSIEAYRLQMPSLKRILATLFGSITTKPIDDSSGSTSTTAAPSVHGNIANIPKHSGQYHHYHHHQKVKFSNAKRKEMWALGTPVFASTTHHPRLHRRC